MRPFHCPFLALTLAAGTCLGQTIGTGDQPRLFFWETSPSGWDDDEFDEWFVPMIRIDVGTLSGENAALAVKADLAALCSQFPSNETFIRSHACILLQNFGTEGTTKFALDEITAPAPWPDDFGPKKPENNPWLNTGVANAKTWMEEFIAELSTGLDAVTPFRFHFDSEFQLCGYSNKNEVALAINVFDTTGTANGGRWNDTDWKIPIGGPSPLTLKQHWDAARVVHTSWPTDPQEMLDASEPPNEPAGGGANNRAFFLWYQRILDLAVEGGMKECAYDLILAEWPSCEISNYEFTNIDQPLAIQTADVFGWQFDFTTANSTVPDPADSFLTRELPLG